MSMSMWHVMQGKAFQDTIHVHQACLALCMSCVVIVRSVSVVRTRGENGASRVLATDEAECRISIGIHPLGTGGQSPCPDFAVARNWNLPWRDNTYVVDSSFGKE